jgi:phenylalanyl-tRNA synthetase beta chain
VSLPLLAAKGIKGAVLAGVFGVLPERLSNGTARLKFREPGHYPAALRDLALVVDLATPAGDVRKAVAAIAAAAAGSAFGVESVDVFDLYEGKGLPAGKKSLALALVFRSPSRTLTDDEVNAALLKVREEVAKATPYQVRT